MEEQKKNPAQGLSESEQVQVRRQKLADLQAEMCIRDRAKPAAFARLLQAPFDEKLSLVSLILSGLETRFSASRRADAVADSCYAFRCV